MENRLRLILNAWDLYEKNRRPETRNNFLSIFSANAEFIRVFIAEKDTKRSERNL